MAAPFAKVALFVFLVAGTTFVFDVISPLTPTQSLSGAIPVQTAVSWFTNTKNPTALKSCLIFYPHANHRVHSFPTGKYNKNCIPFECRAGHIPLGGTLVWAFGKGTLIVIETWPINDTWRQKQ
jgi:hypothetical protein